MSWPWSQLGLSGPSELSEVRRAYAEKLKTTHPEEDPEGFQRLHSAYQLASRLARRQRREGAVPPRGPEPECPSSPEPEPSREDFDFDVLLEGGGEEAPRSRGEDEEQKFDFDRLIQEEEVPPHTPRKKEQDFDFDRLFAEGEAERAEARRLRGEERREGPLPQNACEQGQQFRQGQTRWESTEAVLRTVEMMYSAQTGAEEWQKFFQTPLFQQNRYSIDLIYGLEDFVSTRNLSQEIQLALFQAYGFEKGISWPELRPLYQMLLPAWRAANYEKNRERKLAVLGVVLGLTFPFVLGPLLDWGLIPALAISLGTVWIVWVVRKAIKTGNLERQARGRNMSRKQERRSVILGTVCAVALLAVVCWIRSGPDLKEILPAKDPREQVCRYIEKDLGVEVGSIYNRNEQYATEENGNLFYVEPDTANVFLAGPDGDRDVKHGRAGYTTNLPEMLLLWQLKDFAREYKLAPVDGMDQGLERGETNGIYLITLPPLGGEEIITGLGELLEKLSREEWYGALPPQCQIVMCSREMSEGRIVLIRVHPAAEKYSVSQIQGLYKDGFAHSCCAQLIRELELDRDFMGDASETYTLTNGGMARMKGRDCCKLWGLDRNGTAAMEYYVDLEQNNIYCVPGNFWEAGNTEDQIGFCRLLHWGDDLGLVNLFYPWLRVD